MKGGSFASKIFNFLETRLSSISNEFESLLSAFIISSRHGCRNFFENPSITNDH